MISGSTAAPNFAKRGAGSPKRRRLESSPSAVPRGGKRMRYLLLLVPCVAALWAPLYNFVSPELFGVPFFYWFQLLLVLISAVTIYLFDRLGRA